MVIDPSTAATMPVSTPTAAMVVGMNKVTGPGG